MISKMMSTLTPRGAGLAILVIACSMAGSVSRVHPAAPAAAVNLIQNPSFDATGPTTLTRSSSPWVGEETNVAKIINDGHSHSGAQEAVFQPGGAANQGQLMQMFSCSANTDYVASAWIGGTPNYTTVGQPANNDTTGKPTQRGFGIHIPSTPGTDPDGDGDTQGFDASIIIKYVTITNNSTGSYQFYSFTFNSGAHTKLFVDFDANIPANGILRVDDVSVVLASGGTPTPPSVTSQPASQTVTVGQKATFSVAASGTAPLSYQWERNGVTIAGATGSSYTTPATTLADSGSSYEARVSNAAGSTTSHAALLTVTQTTGAPAITSEPVSRTVQVGQTATFSVSASGTAPLSYQWQKNGTAIAGATGASVTTPAATLGDSGSSFRVVIHNSVGTVTSTAATLTVTPSGSGPLPAPWLDRDIGSVGVAGSATASGGSFTIHASGADIGGTSDEFNYVYQPLPGDGALVARVASLGQTSPIAQAGLMIRESLDPGSPFADMLITPTGAQFQGRIQAGSPNFNQGGPGVAAPYWLKIVRQGSTYTGSTSPDGQAWTQAGTATIPMGQSVWIGMAVVSHNNAVLDVAVLDSVSLTGGAGGSLPAPWVDQDIGSVAVAGSAAASGGVFTVRGSGADIGGTVDAFNYVHQSLSGDGQLIARVTGVTKTSVKAQAGLMIRETLDPSSRFADMLITPSVGASFQGRLQPGGTNFNSGGPAVAEPYWLKIIRSGNTFSGWTSPDGVTWHEAGSAVIPMAPTVFIGLAVTACDNGAVNTAMFDSVSR